MESKKSQNWELNGDCLNLIGELTTNEIDEISKLPLIRVIQPWKFMPSEKTWLELNEKVFSINPHIKLHIWADTIKSDFIFLSKMSHVRHLYLNQVKFKDQQTLIYLKDLKSLVLINGNVNHLEFLSQLKNMEVLEIGRIKGLKEISFISDLTQLKSFNLNNQAQVQKLPDFSGNKELKSVSLITLKSMLDISNLNQLEKLEELAFHGLSNELEPKQFHFLKECKHLKTVRFNFNTKEKNKQFEMFINDLLGVRE
jgi:hypothetical protein